MELKKNKVFIVIPAYNEEQHIPILFPKISQIVSDSNFELRIILVNDGSSDRTRLISEEMAQSLPVQVLTHESNLGVGRVFMTGLRFAVQEANPEDVIVLMEADLTNSPELLPEMISNINEGHNLVIGSRYESGGCYYKFPLKRLVLSILANAVMSFLFPIPGVRDYTIFYRAYRASILAKGFEIYGDSLLEARTFVVNAELLIKLNQVQKISIKEIPLVYRYDLKKGKSKMPKIKTILEYFSFIARMRLVMKSS